MNRQTNLRRVALGGLVAATVSLAAYVTNNAMFRPTTVPVEMSTQPVANVLPVVDVAFNRAIAHERAKLVAHGCRLLWAHNEQFAQYTQKNLFAWRERSWLRDGTGGAQTFQGFPKGWGVTFDVVYDDYSPLPESKLVFGFDVASLRANVYTNSTSDCGPREFTGFKDVSDWDLYQRVVGENVMGRHVDEQHIKTLFKDVSLMMVLDTPTISKYQAEARLPEDQSLVLITDRNSKIVGFRAEHDYLRIQSTRTIFDPFDDFNGLTQSWVVRQEEPRYDLTQANALRIVTLCQTIGQMAFFRDNNEDLNRARTANDKRLSRHEPPKYLSSPVFYTVPGTKTSRAGWTVAGFGFGMLRVFDRSECGPELDWHINDEVRMRIYENVVARNAVGLGLLHVQRYLSAVGLPDAMPVVLASDRKRIERLRSDIFERWNFVLMHSDDYISGYQALRGIREL